MGHGAWGMGHGAWGMGHGAWGMGHGAWGIENSFFFSPLPTARGLIAKQLFADLGDDKRQL